MSNQLAKSAARLWGQLSGSSVTLIGHSHIWAIAEAAKSSKRDLHIVDFWKYANPFAQNELSTLDTILPSIPKGPIVSLIGGSRYNTLTLYESSRPFDYALPHDHNPPRIDAELIPFDAVQNALSGLMLSNLELLTAIRKRTQSALYHLDAPPPWGEDRSPADYPKDPWLQVSDRFGDRWLRLKTAALETRLMREFCKSADIVFIEAPPASKDADGFLRPEYFKDLMHANGAYGQLALAHVLAALKK